MVSRISIVKLSSGDPGSQSSVLQPVDIASRFDELKKLKDGWLDGAGRTPSHEGLDWLARALNDRHPKSLPPPFPTQSRMAAFNSSGQSNAGKSRWTWTSNPRAC